MKEHKCTRCGFTTNKKSTLINHLAAKVPCVEVSDNDCHERSNCKKCNGTYKNMLVLLRHEASCDGTHALQCPKCKETFNNATSKSRHMKKCVGLSVNDDRIPSTTLTATDNSSISMNNVTNSHNTTTVVNITCTPQQKNDLLPFMETDLEAVIKLVLKDPARFQLAMSSGALQQELCKATHFGNIEQNKNVVGIQAKGTQMTVMHNDKKCVMDKVDGIRQIMKNNHAITSNERASQYFKGKSAQLCRAKVCKQISNCVQNKGEYVPTIPFYGKVPTFIAPEKDYESMFETFEQDLLRFYQFDEYDILTVYGKRACCHILHYYKGNWWQSANEHGGWAECVEHAVVIEDCIKQFIQELRDSITKDAPNDRYRMKDVNDAVDVINFNKCVRIVIEAITNDDITARKDLNNM